jgi:hypothetical protein
MSPDARQNLQQVRNFLVISLVTVLIWLLAEAESLRVETVRAELLFRAEADSNRFVRVDPEFPGAVSVRLEGSTARVDDLAAKLRRPLNLVLGMEGIPTEPGRHVVDIRSVLRNLPMVRETGASVAAVDPNSVTLVIDNFITREVKVRADPPPAGVLDGPAEVSPQTVKLRFPESLAQHVPADLELIVPIEQTSLQNLREGQRYPLPNMRPNLPEALRTAEGVRLTPSTVTVSVTVRSRTGTAVLPLVPVHLQLPPTEIGLWDITVPDESRVLNDVPVSGPAEQVEQLKAAKSPPVAFVAISYEELEGAAESGEPLQKEVQFSSVPTALRFDLKPSQRTVRIMVTKRQPAAPAPVVPGVTPPGPTQTPANTSTPR